MKIAGVRELHEVTHVARDDDPVLRVRALEDLTVGRRQQSAVADMAGVYAVFLAEDLGDLG